ncbi:MAG: DUF2851 family protein, partial [Verrucomicrobiae bacterium]|nr:DUF2851 family protein [Verrucomicrobiae bacterium]
DTPVRTQRGDIVPQLILQDQLAAPLEQLHDEIELENYPHNARGHAGHCATTLSRLRADSIRELLNAAGQQRFAEKKRKFARWISQRGAAQAFYEGWMEALGYKANKTPFRMLAQRLPLSEAVELREQLPAVLFGLANFLPTQAASGLARRLWQVWWQVRPQYEDRQLPPHAWRLHGVRPANHPQRRLGLAVTLLQRYPQLLDNMVGAVQSHGNPEKLFLELYEPFWSTHYTLGGRQQRRPIALLGPSRVRELVANVVLPFIAAHAELSGDAGLCAKAATQFATLPAAPGNSLMRLAAQQLFGTSKATGLVKTSLQQQGLLQIFQDFCLQDKSACQRCLFPELVLRWTRSNG